MYEIQKSIHDTLVKTANTLNELSDEAYVRQLTALSGASIGNRVAGMIAKFNELHEGYLLGTITYSEKKSDARIVEDKSFAQRQLILSYKSIYKPDKKLLLNTSYNFELEESNTVFTTYYRELLFLLEFAMYQNLLLKICVMELASSDHFEQR
jgi:hypothetical protein